MSDAETTALAELDRRGGRAATALRTQVDTLVDPDVPARPLGAPTAAVPEHDGHGGPASLTGASGPDDGTYDHGDDPDGEGTYRPDIVRLRPTPPAPSSGRARRARKRAPFLAAAAVVIVAAAVAATFVVGRDGPSDLAGPGDMHALIPSWVPEGMELTRAVRLEDVAGPGPVTPGATIAVYGDTSADDPWADTVWVAAAPGDDPGVQATDEGEPITVDGHPGVIFEGGPALDEIGARWQVVWYAGGATLTVGAADGWTRDDVVAAAEAVDGTTIGAAGLPDGYAELARGNLDAATMLAAGGSATGLALAYEHPAPATGESNSRLGVVQRPGDAAEVDLLRHAFPDGGEATVRGHRAAVGRSADGMVAVQWLEEGRLITVWGMYVDEAEVLRAAEELRPARDGEVRRLLDRYPVNSFGAVPEGHEAVMEGDTSAGNRWRLLVTSGAAEGMSALTYESVAADGGDSYSGQGGESGTGSIELAIDLPEGDEMVLYGVVDAEVATLAVEGAGREPIEVPATEVPGWDGRVFGATVTKAEAAGAALVARDAAGRELDRRPLGDPTSGVGTGSEATIPG